MKLFQRKPICSVEELVKDQFVRLGGDPTKLRVLDVSPYDRPTPPFSHVTTWEITVRGQQQMVRSTIPGDCVLTDLLRMKLLMAADLLEHCDRSPEGMLR